MHEALGLLELSRIARGLVVTDAVVKKAPVLLVRASPISPGKFLVLFVGSVAAVDESMREGAAVAGDALIDSVFLPQVHPAIPEALERAPRVDSFGSLAVVETLSCASTVIAADAALKTADVDLVVIRLAQGLGGKGYFVVSGTLDDAEAARSAALSVTAADLVLAHEVIAAPHDELVETLRR